MGSEISPLSPDYKFRRKECYYNRAPKRKSIFFGGQGSGAKPSGSPVGLIVPIAETLPVPDSKIAYGYTRVSTLMQDQETRTQRWQIENRFKMQFEPQGYTWGGIMTDPAVSGDQSFSSRPAGSEIIRRMLRGNVIIIDRWDRAFRNLVDFGLTIQQWKRAGVSVISLDLGIDATTEAGMAIAAIMTIMAEQQRRATVNRIRETILEKRMRGIYTSFNRPYGFIIKLESQGKGKKPIRRMIPWPEERAIMAEMLQLRQQGYTLPRIAEMMNADGKFHSVTERPWTLGTVRAAIESEVALQLQARAIANGQQVVNICVTEVGREFLMTGEDLTTRRRA